MYAVNVGEEMIRVAEKEDARKLVNILFELDCPERISSKPISLVNTKLEEQEESDGGKQQNGMA